MKAHLSKNLQEVASALPQRGRWQPVKSHLELNPMRSAPIWKAEELVQHLLEYSIKEDG